MHVQFFKNNINVNNMKQEFKMLIKKELATLKKILLNTFKSEQKKIQKDIDTLKKQNRELKVHIEKLSTSNPKKGIYNGHNKENNEIKLNSITEVQELLKRSTILKNTFFSKKN